MQTQSVPRLLQVWRAAAGGPCQQMLWGSQQLTQQQWPAQYHHQQQHHHQQRFASSHQQQSLSSQQPAQQQRSTAVVKVYKGNWILPVRFLVRAKVFQLLGGGSIGVLLGSLAMDEVAFGDVFALAALAGGMVAASCCLWYYSRRYVGEMALMLPDAQRVRFSVLDFWGNREDVIVPVSALKPPFKDVRKKEMQRLASQILFPVNVEGDRQFYVSIHAGKLLEPQAFMSIMKGEYNPQNCPTVVQAQQAWQAAQLGQQQLEQQQQESKQSPLSLQLQQPAESLRQPAPHSS